MRQLTSSAVIVMGGTILAIARSREGGRRGWRRETHSSPKPATSIRSRARVSSRVVVGRVNLLQTTISSPFPPCSPRPQSSRLFRLHSVHINVTPAYAPLRGHFPRMLKSRQISTPMLRKINERCHDRLLFAKEAIPAARDWKSCHACHMHSGYRLVS